MWTKKFWADAAERIASTAAQAAVGALGSAALIQRVDWGFVLGTAGFAAVAAAVKAIAAARLGPSDGAGLFS